MKDGTEHQIVAEIYVHSEKLKKYHIDDKDEKRNVRQGIAVSRRSAKNVLKLFSLFGKMCHELL
ncbi:MAG: hypothetical protein FWG78_02640 [Coriobacteriia bacterium]|nr:hypothetical protein [Coriobacteriia bacterium]